MASALGIWPWTDVYKSGETVNLLVGTLSAGPVGTGDAIGAEDKNNILKAARADGVIVKPDAALVPVDSSYLAEAQNQERPLVASTFTDHGGIHTVYGVVLNVAKKREKKHPAPALSLAPNDVGCSGPVYLYDFFAGTGWKLDAGQSLPIPASDQECSYFIAAPVGPSGIAFLGDPDKFVGTGKKRIAALRDDGSTLTAEVLLAASETQVSLHGYAPTLPQVSVQGGDAGPVQFDPATKLFRVTVQPAAGSAPAMQNGDAVRKLTVAFTLKG
jgi:hypothetical protein